MIFSSRPPPIILVISAEGDGEAYVRYLTTAGFRVTSASESPLVRLSTARLPDARPGARLSLRWGDDRTTEGRLAVRPLFR